MTTKLQDVVIWKPRAVPGARVIPPHLKLAILSRGRINLPTGRVLWLVDEVKSRGSTWLGRLTKPLPEIFKELGTTVELFLKQRRAMSPAEIDESLAGYLRLRREAHLSNCWFLLFTWRPHILRSEIEKRLDLDLSRLFIRPRVYDRPRVDDPYVLLVYICIPKSIQRFLRTGPAPPPPLTVAMPPLAALTTRNTEMTLRSAPSVNGASLGEQDGHQVRVTVLGKAYADGYTWFNVELQEPMRVKKGPSAEIRVGTKAWLAKDGLELITAPWDLFRHDLIAFDQATERDSLPAKVTKLRQRTETRSLPADAVIGSERGDTYLEDIRDDPKSWQLGKDYKSATAPDGRPIDVNHLLAGLDVLRRPETARDFLGVTIGTNWAAATWSGDVGSAAADMKLKTDKYWEGRNSSLGEAERAEYYFSARAGDWDLLGDLDPWETSRYSTRDVSTLDTLVAAFYEQTTSGALRELTAKRVKSIERLLAYYGFTYDYSKDLAQYPAFVKQREAVRRISGEVWKFAQAWMYYRKRSLVYSGSKAEREPDSGIVIAMTAQLLYWLEYAAIENGASVSSAGP
jgi:hypothetical protein